MDDARVLQVAVEAARAGGRVALERLGSPGYLRWKGFRDVEVGAALEVQQAIVERIRADFPEHPILAEEGLERPAEDADPLWIVDPVDGSLNYLHGLPVFAVSVAFRSEGLYRVGVVYDPCREELFQGVLGQGARLNGEPIYVHQVEEGLSAYEHAMVGTDWPYGTQARVQSLQVAHLLCSSTLSLVTLGSPALGLCYVACGRLHAYYHLDLDLWDVAAAAVVLREAGATLTNAEGSSWLHANRGYLATNGIVHGEVLRNIAAVRSLYGGRPRA